MITGFNTDIEFDGQVFHVQTEDKGRENPIIETLVYTGGQIVCARKTSYSELLGDGNYSETEVQKRMEDQHRELIRDIREGKADKEDLQPFGASIISNRSFDEVVSSFLQERLPVEKIVIELLERKSIQAGERAVLKFAVTEATTERPLTGASVVVSLIARDRESTHLWAAITDDEGCITAPCEIPDKPGVGAAVVCAADAAGVSSEVRCRVRRPRASVQRA